MHDGIDPIFLLRQPGKVETSVCCAPSSTPRYANGEWLESRESPYTCYKVFKALENNCGKM